MMLAGLARVRIAYVALAVALAVSASACNLANLSFRMDERVDIVEPDERAEITLPVTVRWTVEDFEVGPGRGSFAVFVDRSPQPPGRTVESMFEDDDACQARPDCPDEAFLADRGVYTTYDTSLTLQHLPQLAASGRRDLHEVAVVLLDADGERVGEGSWLVTFEVIREP